MTSRLTLWTLTLGIALTAMTQAAAIQESTVEYQDGDSTLEGFMARPDTIDDKTPAILIIHDWTGLQDYEKKRARMLADLGYIAFAADIYGKGIRPDTPEASKKQATTFYNDPERYRHRLQLALDTLRKQPGVDRERIAAIGYCFGGAGVLELARSGADIAGVVSFHGSLTTKKPAKQGEIKAKILVLTGADDPYVPWGDLKELDEELRQADADYQFIIYGDAVHSFTKKAAGDDPSSGAAYDAKADARSWEHMRFFFDELFGPQR